MPLYITTLIVSSIGSILSRHKISYERSTSPQDRSPVNTMFTRATVFPFISLQWTNGFVHRNHIALPNSSRIGAHIKLYTCLAIQCEKSRKYRSYTVL